MSISALGPSWSRIESMSGGIFARVYRGPAGPRSAAQGSERGHLAETLRGQGADPFANGAVVLERDQPIEQEELLRRGAAPAPVEVELGEREVQLRVRRGDRERHVTRIEGGVDRPCGAV